MIDQVPIGLSQVESILEISVGKNAFEGLIFPFTVDYFFYMKILFYPNKGQNFNLVILR